MNKQTAEKKMQGCISGAFTLEQLNAEILFVTLNKSEKNFSPSTMYDDYVVNENQFHWQSQANVSHNGTGKCYTQQSENKKKFILFVREYKTDGYGNTFPFYCFGLVDYINSYGNKPMSINWRMHQSILPQFVNAV